MSKVVYYTYLYYGMVRVYGRCHNCCSKLHVLELLYGEVACMLMHIEPHMKVAIPHYLDHTSIKGALCTSQLQNWLIWCAPKNTRCHHVIIITTWNLYEHLIHHICTSIWVLGNWHMLLKIVLRHYKICKCTTMVHLQFYYNDAQWLSRTHMLVVSLKRRCAWSISGHIGQSPNHSWLSYFEQTIQFI